MKALRLIALALLLVPLSAAAQSRGGDPENSTLALHGFATFGLARINNSAYGLTDNYGARRALYDRWSPVLDSVAGAQAALNLSESRKAVVQLIARADESMQPRPTQAFLSQQLGNELILRVGRIASPLFLDSETINVGYANLAVRPPMPVYAKFNAWSSFDGFDVTKKYSIGAAKLGVQGFVGQYDYTHRVHTTASDDLDAKGSNLRGLLFQLHSGNLLMRAGYYSTARFSIRSSNLDTLSDSARQMAPNLRALGRAAQADALVSLMNPLDSSNAYRSFAIDWSPDEWRLLAEWSHLTFDSALTPNTDAWQVTIGRSIGRLTPFGFVSAQVVKMRPLPSGAFAATGIAQVDAGLNTLSTSFQQIQQSTNLGMRSAGIGVRFDIADHFAIKAQAERVRSAYELAALAGVSPSAVPERTLLSVTVDLAF